MGSGCSLMASRWQVFLLPEFSQGSPAHHPWWLQLLMTLTPLFTEVAGSIPFLRSVMARTGASSLTPDKPDAVTGM